MSPSPPPLHKKSPVKAASPVKASPKKVAKTKPHKKTKASPKKGAKKAGCKKVSQRHSFFVIRPASKLLTLTLHRRPPRSKQTPLLFRQLPIEIE
jgi:hypothetical protein